MNSFKLENSSLKFRLFALAVCLGLAGAILVLSQSILNRDEVAELVYPTRQVPAQDKSFYEDAFALVSMQEASTDKVGGLFVNHHLIAPELIAQSLLTARNQRPQTIVLISPNHFTAGYGRIITSEYDWETPFGTIASDRRLIQELKTDDELFTVDETPFKGEHGIYGVIPFVKRAFPQSMVLPLLVKDRASDDEIDRMVELLDEVLPDDALLVGSFDFSHYLSSDAADFTDAKSLAMIKSFDYESMGFWDVDSKQGLRLMLKLLERRGFTKFNEVAHTNSAKLSGNYEFTEITSYINGYFTAGEKSKSDSVTMLYFGKWSNAGMKYSNWRNTNYPLAKMDRIFGGADVTIGKTVDGAVLNSELSRLGYLYLLKGEGDYFSKRVRGKEITVFQISSVEDIQTFMGVSGLRVAFTDRLDLVQGIVQAGARAVLVDAPVAKIELYGKTPVLYGFGRTAFGEAVESDQDVLAGLEFGGEKTVIRLFPTEFDGLIRLIPRSRTDKIMNEIANASDEDLRNQIKNFIINIE